MKKAIAEKAQCNIITLVLTLLKLNQWAFQNPQYLWY